MLSYDGKGKNKRAGNVAQRLSTPGFNSDTKKKREKAQNLWAEDMNRKHDGNVLNQKVLRLYKNFGKGSLETSDTNPFTAKVRLGDRNSDSGIVWD